MNFAAGKDTRPGFESLTEESGAAGTYELRAGHGGRMLQNTRCRLSCMKRELPTVC